MLIGGILPPGGSCERLVSRKARASCPAFLGRIDGKPRFPSIRWCSLAASCRRVAVGVGGRAAAGNMPLLWSLPAFILNASCGPEHREARGASRGNAFQGSKRGFPQLALRASKHGTFLPVRLKPRSQTMRQDGESSGAHGRHPVAGWQLVGPDSKAGRRVRRFLTGRPAPPCRCFEPSCRWLTDGRGRLILGEPGRGLRHSSHRLKTAASVVGSVSERSMNKTPLFSKSGKPAGFPGVITAGLAARR